VDGVAILVCESANARTFVMVPSGPGSRAENTLYKLTGNILRPRPAQPRPTPRCHVSIPSLPLHGTIMCSPRPQIAPKFFDREVDDPSHATSAADKTDRLPPTSGPRRPLSLRPSLRGGISTRSLLLVDPLRVQEACRTQSFTPRRLALGSGRLDRYEWGAIFSVV
jgi:hypothetical protein